MDLLGFFKKGSLKSDDEFPETEKDFYAALSKELNILQDKIGYYFKNHDLLVRALTHRSFANERGNCNYERLEFLGDAVLDLALAFELMNRFPNSPEGQLTQMRSALVSEQMLARMARYVDLGSYLLLGRGEELTGGRDKASILADAYEALMGALFLDAGFQKASDLIIDLFSSPLEEVGNEDFHRDYKSELQQIVQERFKETPQYVLKDQWGPAHKRGFRVELRFMGKVLGVGTGLSKKEAEQKAARQALMKNSIT